MSEPVPTPDAAPRLEAISTSWATLFAAHADGPEASAARGRVALRYRDAVRRYLEALLGDPGEADEVTQELMLRILRGGFAGADPQRGRFRDLLKTAVRRMAVDHLRRRGRTATLGDADGLPGSAPADRAWIADCRRVLVDAALGELESLAHRRPGNVYHAVLMVRADHPDADSQALAARLSERVGRAFTVDQFRQQLHRAREAFAEILVRHVAFGLPEPTPERLTEELGELGLAVLVRDFLPTLRVPLPPRRGGPADE